MPKVALKTKYKKMKFPQPYTIKQIAAILKVEYIGEPDFLISGCNEIHRVEAGDIVFVDHPKYYDKALKSAATTILINKKVDCPEGKTLLISEDPFSDFNKLSAFFKPFIPSKNFISVSATIGENVTIQPGVFIGNNVKIGNGVTIHANVSIYDDCEIGDNVTIHANTVIGSDAFYYKNRPEGFDKLLSTGLVIIENNVDIGASCTIDKGVSAATTIGEGSKLDNQIHIGHDTIIGKKCLIASQTGIAGCVIVEDEVTIWGQVGTNSGITIGAKAVILGQTGVTKSVAGGKTYFGTPIYESREKLKELAFVRKLPKVLESIKESLKD